MDALARPGGSVGEVAPEKVRAKTVKHVTCMGQPGETLFRAAEAKVGGEAPEIAMGVRRAGGSGCGVDW